MSPEARQDTPTSDRPETVAPSVDAASHFVPDLVGIQAVARCFMSPGAQLSCGFGGINFATTPVETDDNMQSIPYVLRSQMSR